MQTLLADNIPPDIRNYPQWVVWRLSPKEGGGFAKIPYQAKIPTWPASVGRPESWATFDEAVAAVKAHGFDGIGFVFTENDPFFGVDVDDINKVAPEHVEARKAFDDQVKTTSTYIEVSPSGNGLHLIGSGVRPELMDETKGGGNDSQRRIEVYWSMRYFTFTGHTINGLPITPQQDLLDWLVKHICRTPVEAPVDIERSNVLGRRLDMTDQEVIDKAVRLNSNFVGMFNAQVGHMPGEWSDTYFKLLGDLDYITGDPEQMRRIVMNSPFVTISPPAKDGQSRSYKAYRTFDSTLMRVRNDPFHNSRMFHTENGRQLVQSLEAAKEARLNAANERALREAQAAMKQWKGNSRKVLEKYGLDPRYLLLGLPPGVVGRYVEATMAACHYPFMKYAIPTTLTVLSGILGRKYKVNRQGLNSNFLLVAPTASGKTDVMSVWESFMLTTVVMPSDQTRVFESTISSIQGIHERFSETLSGAWFVDECSDLINKMSSPKTATDEQMRSALNKLYDASKPSTRFSVPASKATAGLLPIHNLNISTLWATTPSKFDAQTADAEDGFLSRLTIVYHNDVAGRANRNPTIGLPYDLASILKGLMKNLSDFDAMFDPRAVDQIVDIDTSAVEARLWEFREVGDTIREMTLPSQADLPKHYTSISRLALNALKLSGVLAVMDNPYSPKITVEQYDWAIGYLLQNMLGLLSGMDNGEVGVTMSHDIAVVVRIMRDLLKRNKGNPVKRSELTDTLRHTKPFKDAMPSAGVAVNRTIDGMIKDGQLDEQQGKSSGGRPPLLLYATDAKCWSN